MAAADFIIQIKLFDIVIMPFLNFIVGYFNYHTMAELYKYFILVNLNHHIMEELYISFLYLILSLIHRAVIIALIQIIFYLYNKITNFKY